MNTDIKKLEERVAELEKQVTTLEDRIKKSLIETVIKSISEAEIMPLT